MATRKPKTARRARFTGALGRPIVRPDPRRVRLAAALLNEDPEPRIKAAADQIEREIIHKIGLLAEHYGIDTKSEAGDILPNLALALCFDLVEGFRFVDKAPAKKGRPVKDWSGLHRFVREQQGEGRTIDEAVSAYHATMPRSKRPTTKRLKAIHAEHVQEQRQRSEAESRRLIDAVLQARRDAPDWMRRLFNGGGA